MLTQKRSRVLSVLFFGVSLCLIAVAFGENLHAAEYEPPYVLEFDGSEDCLFIGHDRALDMTDEITVEAWFMQRDVKSDYHMIVHKSPTNNAWLLLNDQGAGASGDRIGWRWYDGQGAHTIEANGLDESEWYHVAGVHDGSEGKLYINGELVGSSAAPFEPVTGEELQIGAGRPNPDTRYFWNGKIAEVRIYNRALSQDEIAENMYKNLAGDEDGLVGYWPLDEGEGETAYDKSAGENHGTIVGAGWWREGIIPSNFLAAPADERLPFLAQTAEEHESEGLRMHAARALGRLDAEAEKVAAPLLIILKNTEETEQVRLVALGALEEAEAGGEEVLSVMLEILKDIGESDYIRMHVLDKLTKINTLEESIVTAFLGLLKDTEDLAQLRLRVFETLCEAGPEMRKRIAGDPDVKRALSQLLQGGEASHEIARLSSETQKMAVPHLAESLLDTESEKCVVHLRAAAALDRIGMDKVEESLESAQVESVRNALEGVEELGREIARKRYDLDGRSWWPATRKPRSYEVIDSTKVMSAHGRVWQGGFLTAGEYQYAVFYDGDLQLTAAARSLDSNEWDIERLPDHFDGARSGRSLVVDSEGILHYTGNMHSQPLVYFRTLEPGDISTFERIDEMVGSEENSMAYPNFFTCVEGELYFTYRYGRSGQGVQMVNEWDAQEQRWSRLPSLFDGLGREEAFGIPRLGSDGYFHLFSAWRVSACMNDENRIVYAWSEDMENWKTASGEDVDMPITPETEGVVVDPTGVQQGLLSPYVGFDAKDRRILTYTKYDEEDINQIYNVRLEEDEWVTYQTSDWEWKWHFGGVGAQTFKIRYNQIITTESGRLIQDYQHWKVDPDGFEKRNQNPRHRSMRWVLDPDTLKPLLNVKLPKGRELWPEEMFPEDSDQEVHFLEDMGECGEEGVYYVLRYTTSGEPDMRVFKLRGEY